MMKPSTVYSAMPPAVMAVTMHGVLAVAPGQSENGALSAARTISSKAEYDGQNVAMIFGRKPEPGIDKLSGRQIAAQRDDSRSECNECRASHVIGA